MFQKQRNPKKIRAFIKVKKEKNATKMLEARLKLQKAQNVLSEQNSQKQDKLSETNVVHQAVCSCRNLDNREMQNHRTTYIISEASFEIPNIHRSTGTQGGTQRYTKERV
jgi:hypothetical protein